MADAVTTQILKDHAKGYAIKLTNISDGTGETNVIKVDASALVANTGVGAERLNITKLFWSIASGTSSTMSPRVTLSWAGSANTIIATITGSGYWDLTTGGQCPFINNASSPTGDILVTTTGFTANAAYTVVIEGKKIAGFASRETTDDGFTP